MKHASIYQRRDSPYYWAAFWSPKTLKRELKATPFRIDDPRGKRRALAWLQPFALEAAILKSTTKRERWESWVQPFLDSQYAQSPRTLIRYQAAWHQWLNFLTERKILTPEGLDYSAIRDFVDWRQAQIKPVSKRPINRNTAIEDLRVMSLVMQEAVRRGYARGNPCFRTGLKRIPAKEKPELTDKHIELIRRKLPHWIEDDPTRAWMPIAFEIAIHQGCRLRETQLDLDHDVDFARNTLMFHAKGTGGQKKIFTTALHPKLKPLLQMLKNKGHRQACTVPIMGAKQWCEFFDELKMPDHSFHCTRVTVVTRMARAGVPVQQAMRFVGHASETIHRIYQRLNTEDLGACVAAVNF